MVERLAALFCSRDEYRKIVANLLLADEFDKALRADGGFQRLVGLRCGVKNGAGACHLTANSFSALRISEDVSLAAPSRISFAMTSEACIGA